MPAAGTPSAQEPMDPLIDQMLFLGKPYIVKSKLGGGGFGKVYEIEDHRKNTFAVKKIDFNDENGDTYDNGIPCLMEAALMATYKHPNINSAIEIVVKDDVLYIIQEKADTTLYDFIKYNEVSREEIINIFHDILCGLEFFHDQKIVHGDIKPDNILMVNGSVKITDYNLSYYEDWDVNINVGTSPYKPLEAWENDWDKSIDIWALGCTIYYCVFGKMLFKYQGGDDYTRKEKNRAYINALYDWEVIWIENNMIKQNRGSLRDSKPISNRNSSLGGSKPSSGHNGSLGGSKPSSNRNSSLGGSNRNGSLGGSGRNSSHRNSKTKENNTKPAREYYKVEYKVPKPNKELFSNDPLHQAIFNMLSPIPENRYNVKQILDLSIFPSKLIKKHGTITRLTPLMLNTMPPEAKLISLTKDNILIDCISNASVITDNLDFTNVSNIANKIYHRYKEYITADSNIKLIKTTIAWMARKIVRQHDYNEDRPAFITDNILSKVSRIERDICSKLSFRLI